MVNPTRTSRAMLGATGTARRRGCRVIDITITADLPPKGKGRPRVADWCDLDNETLSELRSTRSSRKSSR